MHGLREGAQDVQEMRHEGDWVLTQQLLYSHDRLFCCIGCCCFRKAAVPELPELYRME